MRHTDGWQAANKYPIQKPKKLQQWSFYKIFVVSDIFWYYIHICVLIMNSNITHAQLNESDHKQMLVNTQTLLIDLYAHYARLLSDTSGIPDREFLKILRLYILTLLWSKKCPNWRSICYLIRREKEFLWEASGLTPQLDLLYDFIRDNPDGIEDILSILSTWYKTHPTQKKHRSSVQAILNQGSQV